jgi:hypothetical protein
LGIGVVLGKASHMDPCTREVISSLGVVRSKALRYLSESGSP